MPDVPDEDIPQLSPDEGCTEDAPICCSEVCITMEEAAFASCLMGASCVDTAPVAVPAPVPFPGVYGGELPTGYGDEIPVGYDDELPGAHAPLPCPPACLRPIQPLPWIAVHVR